MRLISTNTNSQKQISIDDVVVLKNGSAISCSGNLSTDEDDNPDENLPDEDSISESICAFCKNDFAGKKLDKLSVYPICDFCKTDINKKTFPLWVKLFFAGVLILVAFSVFWNWRFYAAYANIKKANIAAGQNDILNAANLMTKASEEVSEVKSIGEMANYYTAINLLRKDKSSEALKALDNCKSLPDELHVNDLILQAEMGAGYDKKDYQLFLTSAKAFLRLDTTQAQSWAGVASAYACLYTQKNADSLKQQSLRYINKAKTMDDTSADAKEYYGRILYRLDTKQIITKEQFDQKYPKGYISNN